jgi:hypothetical protein
MALLAAAAFSQFTQVSRHSSIGWYRFVTWLGYTFSGLGMILAIAGIIVTIDLQLGSIVIPTAVRSYAMPAICLGCGWMTIPILWHRWQPPSLPYWLVSWLVPAWFTVFSFGMQGALVDKSPDFMTAFSQPSISQVIGREPVNLLSDTVETNGFGRVQQPQHALGMAEHRSLVLLTFYTPHLGRRVANFTDLPDRSYAWALTIPSQFANQTRVIGKVCQWQLIQKIGT